MKIIMTVDGLGVVQLDQDDRDLIDRQIPSASDASIELWRRFEDACQDYEQREQHIYVPIVDFMSLMVELARL